MRLTSLLLLAVLMLWLLGAHNRLMRLRALVRQTLLPLLSLWRQQQALALTLAQTTPALLGLPPASDDDDPQVAALHIAAAGARLAAEQAGKACDVLQLRKPPTQSLQQAQTAAQSLQQALAPVLAALQHQPDLDPASAELLRQQAQLQQKAWFASQTYQAAAEDYNAALRVMPTTLAAWLLGFRPAELLLAASLGTHTLAPH